MSDFKKAVVDFKTVIFTNQPRSEITAPHPQHLGLHVMTQLIPKMEATGDVAFAWHWKRNDVCVYNPAEYAEETGMYNKKGLKMDKGDTTWFYDYTYKGNKRRCILTTEIWYNKTERFRISPFAFLFRQYMAEGLHITKVRFVNQPPQCCLCQKPCECEYGNNPYPLRDEGVCCDKCNSEKVLPARLASQKPKADEMPPLCVAECGSDGCAKHGH